jgi:hypothetical protein
MNIPDSFFGIYLSRPITSEIGRNGFQTHTKSLILKFLQAVFYSSAYGRDLADRMAWTLAEMLLLRGGFTLYLFT